MKSLTDRLIDAIDTSGRSRYEIAKVSGVSAGQLSRLVHGTQTLSVANLEKVAAALGLAVTLTPTTKPTTTKPSTKPTTRKKGT